MANNQTPDDQDDMNVIPSSDSQIVPPGAIPVEQFQPDAINDIVYPHQQYPTQEIINRYGVGFGTFGQSQDLANRAAQDMGLGNVPIHLSEDPSLIGSSSYGESVPFANTIHLNPEAEKNGASEGTIPHEFAHIADQQQGYMGTEVSPDSPEYEMHHKYYKDFNKDFPEQIHAQSIIEQGGTVPKSVMQKFPWLIHVKPLSSNKLASPWKEPPASYAVGGGVVPPGAIPEDQFNQAQQPSEQLPPGSIPIEQFQSDEDKYGTLLETAKAYAEQAASGATLGLSKVAETHGIPALGIPPITTPEAIAGREAAAPIGSFVSNVGGAMAGLLGPEELLSPIKAAQLAGEAIPGMFGATSTLARLAGYATEGAVIGGVNRATDDWSQNKPLDAQKIVASAGLGSLLGVAGGVIGEKLKPKATAIAGTSEEATRTGTPPPPPPTGAAVIPPSDIAVDAPQEIGRPQPKSYQEVVDNVKRAQAEGNAIDLPQKAIFLDARSRVPMKVPFNQLQIDSLTGPESRNIYNGFKELPGEVGELLNNTEAAQKNELIEKIENAITSISPTQAITADAIQGGKMAVDAFSKNYSEEQAALSPILNKLKGLPLGPGSEGNIINRMVQAVPGISDMLTTDANGLKVKPYLTKMGIDEATYKAVKQAVASLNEGEINFKDLWNIRKGLDQNIDITQKGAASAEIGRLKKALMDAMQDSSPTDVRETFRRYAINEQNREVIEKQFGASVGSPEFKSISKVKPEEIGDKIFANSATVDAAKKILTKEQFNNVLANWIAENKAKYTKLGTFSSNNFGNFLTANKDALGVAFADNPAELQRLNDATNLMRILPDAPRGNPSGTANMLLRGLKNAKLHNITWPGLLATVPQYAVNKFEKAVVMNSLNKALAGQAAKNSAQSVLKNRAAGVTKNLDKAIKSMFFGTSGEARKEQ